MRYQIRKIGWWLVLLTLIPALASAADDPRPKEDGPFFQPGEYKDRGLDDEDDPFPQPYIYNDRGLGDTEPRFTFNESGALPDWLSLAVQLRTRYETFNSHFGAGTTGSDQTLSLRTLAQATVHLHPSFKIQLEFQDSRAELADTGTRMSTAIVNVATLLEANLQWLAKGLFQEDSRSLLRGGRLTMDIGKRRLVARNRFRNTLNSFTGVDWIWQAKSGNTARAFFTLPVTKLPITRAELLENKWALDEETLDHIFWGVFFANPSLPWGDQGEFYLFGLHENDRPDFLTRNRQLYTPGFRLYRPAEQGRIDYEWESILQLGTSRATSALGDIQDLDHFAHYHHIEAGYTFQTRWSPRLVLAYDYASGDADPNDGKNGRFDPLFGATVFDFVPTGIYRPFIRSNITGPSIKFQIWPHKHVSTSIQYRVFWLASNTDIWAGNSGLRDPTGNSSSFLGQHWFVRTRWQALANMQLEGGVAYRIDGDFQETVPNSPREGNTLYFYISTILSF